MVVVLLHPNIYAIGALAVSVLGILLFFLLRHGNVPTKPNLVNESSHSHEASPPEKNTETEIIIVGAGVAGSALAHTLGKDGRRVHVIERDLTEPDRMVGEILQPGGYLKLIELGLEDCLEGIDAQRILGFVFSKDGYNAKCSYPLENFQLNVAARCFRNGKFISKMRTKATTLPNVRMEQGTVTSLIEENGIVKGVYYKTKSGQDLKAFAPLTIVCDGCFSNLRRSLSKPKVDVPSQFVGVVLEQCTLPFANYGQFVLADPSPVVLYQISSYEVRCLIDVPGKKLPSITNGEMVKYLRNLVAPQVPKKIRDAFIVAVEKGNIRTMPIKTMPAIPNLTPGVLLLGDAFNMRHAITGGGMTVALSDIVVLRDLIKQLNDLHDPKLVCKFLESFYIMQKPTSSIINTLAGILHTIFSAPPDQATKELGQACFGYLSLGGSCSSGIMALLSGLNPSPSSLVFHLLAVVMYGVGRILFPFPSPKRIWLGAKLFKSGLCIIFPIIKAEGVKQMFLSSMLVPSKAAATTM